MVFMEKLETVHWTFVFVLGSSLIASNESQEFNFPFDNNKLFTEHNKNNEVVEPGRQMDLVRRNELKSAPNNQF